MPTRFGFLPMDQDLWIYVVAGFIAQLIDGALGMAYGISASSLLVGLGVPPALVSSTVHAAECFTTGASAISHHAFGNISRDLFRRLLIPGVIGAALGAYVLTSIDGEVIKPWVSAYLMIMGLVIVLKAYRPFPTREVNTRLTPLAFVGSFLDAVGGGGWGPIVATNLIVRGNSVRHAVGSVNAVEFFVTLSASVTFFLSMGLQNWQVIAALAAGGVLAAPLGAWLAHRLPHRPMMVMVGVLVFGISLRTLWKSLA
jgi:uncharacterized membrane protein YfcA